MVPAGYIFREGQPDPDKVETVEVIPTIKIVDIHRMRNISTKIIISSYFYPYSPMGENKIYPYPPISIHIVLWIKIDLLYPPISSILSYG